MERVAAPEVAGHVVADLDVDGRRLGETEVRKEGRDALDVIERDVNPLGERTQRISRQIAVLPLDRPQLVDDDWLVLRILGDGRAKLRQAEDAVNARTERSYDSVPAVPTGALDTSCGYGYGWPAQV